MYQVGKTLVTDMAIYYTFNLPGFCPGIIGEITLRMSNLKEILVIGGTGAQGIPVVHGG
jgi:hypothetical protein